MKKIFFIALIVLAVLIGYSKYEDYAYEKLTNAKKSSKTTDNEPDFSTLISEGEFALAHKMLQEEIGNTRFLDDNVLGEHKAGDLYTKADLLYRSWVLDIIYSDNDNPQAQIAQLLMEYPIFGAKKSGLQHAFYSDNAFLIGSIHFNQLCDKLLTAAISVKKYDVAEVIVDAYMEDPEVTQGERDHDKNGKIVYPKVDGINVKDGDCYVKFTKKSQTEARNKLKEARR